MKVTLIDWPRDIVGTFSKVWAMSKTNGDWENVKPDEEEFIRMFDADVPVMRFANFVWIIEDMRVFFREQLVRAKHEDFWIQSMRVADFSGGIHTMGLPNTTEVSTAEEAISDAYQAIIEAGHPEEVARRILPLATIHRGAWFTNLQALTERFKKRSCWVAEDLWVGVLSQVRAELVEKVHPLFSNIATPPCFSRGSDRYKGCSINEIMVHRDTGKDPLPLCPLWESALACKDPQYAKLYSQEDNERTDQFAKLWGRDPHSGATISK